MAIAYYVKTGGSDVLDGFTPATAWATIAKVVATATNADTALFNGGDTFNDAILAFTSKTSMTFGSYGTGRAIIQFASNDGIALTSCTSITIQDLIVNGCGANGINITTSMTGLVVRNVDVTANTTNGLSFITVGGTGSNNLVQDSYAASNLGDGWNMHGAGLTCTFTRTVGTDHIGTSGSDAFTNHETSVMTCNDCIAWGNVDGWHFTNTSGTNILNRCYGFKNGQLSTGFAGQNVQQQSTGGATSMRACIMVSADTPFNGASGAIRAVGACSLEIYNCTLIQGNTSATVSYIIYFGDVDGRVTMQNNVFLVGAGGTATAKRCIRTNFTTGTQGNLIGCDHNLYDADWTANLFLCLAATTTYTAWTDGTNKLSNGLTNIDVGSTQEASLVLNEESVGSASSDQYGGRNAIRFQAGSPAFSGGVDLSGTFTTDFRGATYNTDQWARGHLAVPIAGAVGAGGGGQSAATNYSYGSYRY